MAPSAMPIASEGPLTDAALSRSLSKSATTTTHHQPASTTTTTTPPLAPLDASLLTTTLVATPRPVPATDSPARRAQDVCTDHMITCRWTASAGWTAPSLQPYGPLSLMPTASVLHYATECFEGLKLYRGVDGRLRLFRPARNAKRMLVSAARIALPSFDPAELLKLIVRLCAVDGKRWLPKSMPGEFLYLRPTMIADDAALGVQRPKSALLYVILACFPRMDTVPGGMRLLASEEETVRAWPGGFGYAKVGANYGPSLAAQGEARARGFQQVLWLLGREGRVEVTEAGASNFFVVWRNREGVVEMVTAPLGERVILDGVTRRSVLELAEERLVPGWQGGEKVRVLERRIEMREIEEAVLEGRMIEAFAVGTAFFVSAVSYIQWRGNDLKIPMAAGETGKYAGLLKGWLGDIMYGREQHEWGYVVEEEEE